MKPTLNQLLIALVSLILVACGTAPVEMTSSSEVPAAEGEIQVQKEGDQGAMRYELQVRHLAPPEKIDQDTSAYVVWLRPSDSDTPQNEGPLNLKDNLSAEHQGVTSFENFEIFVTAEPNVATTEPTGPIVLQAEYGED